jgi:hypothetical protein
LFTPLFVQASSWPPQVGGLCPSDIPTIQPVAPHHQEIQSPHLWFKYSEHTETDKPRSCLVFTLNSFYQSWSGWSGQELGHLLQRLTSARALSWVGSLRRHLGVGRKWLASSVHLYTPRTA